MSKPRISVNKLGEYLTATPSRRKRIIEDQQQPKTFIAARYSDARKEIVEYLSTGMNDESKILSATAELRISNGGSEFVEQDRQASASAIEDFLEASGDLDLEGLFVESGESTSSNNMEVAGVDISMRPDAVLKDQESGQVVGCVKLHFPKTSPLTPQAAEYVATAMRVYLESTEKNSAIDHSKCYVVDVPTQRVVIAPKSFKRKMHDIEAACEEIDARWKNKG
ncbi:hypothetical protein H8K38_07790 [Undibacterium sp. FT79W]|uniref:hypothetical protein n=1 Tax=Undibacterium sp. FT79W TaxID=2762296 RepID=UPI00164B6D37|nr:hypothetical protein [Undibacterium sp. FT79W]MBC3877703.1 hypothetical protein [Undibacterium sp. FT79W]